MKKLEILANQDSVEFNISKIPTIMSELQKLFKEKEYRFNYVSLVAKFIYKMIRISLELKKLPIEQRKTSLAIQIK